MHEVLFYENRNRRCPTKKFLASLKIKTRAKIMKWIEKLAEKGPYLPRPYADTVKGKIRELRVIFGSDCYRFFY